MISETVEEHRKNSSENISCGVITLSDTKYRDLQNNEKTDTSGEYLFTELKKNYEVSDYQIIPDESDILLKTIENMINQEIDVIFTTGGTGIGSRDITIETIKPLFEKQLDGFGEIFRAKTYEILGSAAILSRATAGSYKDALIFSMPGSPNAVKLGVSIVIDELQHLVKHLKE
ncbi:molybdenum cofactor biosynthesis protein B [Methanobrevibacter cuticularis]|uniref:Molybdenum cofactor biosynthesis protein B n=1 Tax=Methanobrevibacter cuticularis TaxID=47311 RepID=A0A166E768_9EURY|nr:MogA/MoaB family molybdenum cofactor biosynthesis protein [Methanobrevibacter cuticularis]KZX16352.1 molybdenum cofactor biosynthesis protein B [Methanobrevibacter cuticularis]